MDQIRTKEGWFSKPVQISVGIFGDVRNVLSARQAVDMLTNHWHGGGTPKHREARHACLRAANGEGSVDTARESFIQAAREARILIE